MKRILFLFGFFLIYGISIWAEEVAVWGWRTKIWEDFFRKEFSQSVSILKPGEKGRIPVEEFSKYKLIILDQGGPEIAATDEELNVVRNYLSSGGKILLFSGTVAAWLHGKTIYDLSRAEDIIGAGAYIYGEFETEILSPENPIVKDFDKKNYEWFKTRGPALGSITTAKVIVGARLTQGTSARFLLNQFGKGLVIYLSPVAIASYKEGWEKDPEAECLINLTKKIINMCLKNEPPVEKVLSMVKGRKLEAIEIDGKKRPVNIKAEGPFINSAFTLAKYINQITDSEIRVNESLTTSGILNIYVGQNKEIEKFNLDFANLHPYGYYIYLVNPDTLIIAGKNLTGTDFAVFDFLKRFAGYRYFMPGELGEITPKKDAIILPSKIAIKEEPSFITYTNTGFYGGNGAFFRSWRTTLLASHWLYKIYPQEKYGETHPEYYPMIEGKRFIPPKGMTGTWQPCVSNPDLPKIAIEYAKGEYFPKNPEALGFSVGVNDGGGDCQCPKCTELKEKYNNQYIPFYNEIAKLAQKELPGKLVCFIAYGRGASPVPKNIKLEPNLYVEICSGLQNNMELMKKWKEAGAKNIGLYDYLYGTGYVLPRYYPHVIGNAWKEAYKKYGLRGAWTESFIQVWLYDGPRQYVLNELAWNINEDIDKLLDDYFNNFYGESASTMRKFFDRIEEVYSRKKDPLYPIADWQKIDQFEEYTWEDLNFLDKKFEEAKALAKDEKVKKRLLLFEKIWGLSRLYLESYLVMKDLKNIEKIQNEKQIEMIIKKVNEGLKAVREIDTYQMDEWEEKSIFVNTNLNKYRNIHTLKTGPYLENEADRVFTLISNYLTQKDSWEKTREFWKNVASETNEPHLKAMALTQIYIKESPEVNNNLIKNPGFEPEQETGEVFTDKDLERFDWKRLDKKIPGWSIWHFQQSVTRFYHDPTEAHTGKYSLSIRENQISGCFQTWVAITPGCRYKLSFWVKQNPPDKGGNMTIRFMDSKGWVDQGENTAPRIIVPYPVAKESSWRKVEFTFTAPSVATTCVPLFSAPVQTQNEAIWFDDISMVKIYDPNFFKEGK